jgi:hypothetical protein
VNFFEKLFKALMLDLLPSEPCNLDFEKGANFTFFNLNPFSINNFSNPNYFLKANN